MRPKFCLQTYSNATAAIFHLQLTSFIGALETPSQPQLSIVSVITKEQHWPSCLFLIQILHWSASLPLLGPAIRTARTNLIAKPLFINMIWMEAKLPSVLSLLPERSTTSKLLVLSSVEMNLEYISWKTIKQLYREITMELTASTMAMRNSTREWKRSKFGE